MLRLKALIFLPALIVSCSDSFSQSEEFQYKYLVTFRINFNIKQ